MVRGRADLEHMSIHCLDLNGMHQWITVHVSWHRARTSLDEHMSICNEFAQSTATRVTVNGMHQWIIVHVSWHGARTSLDERVSTCNEFEQSTATSATTYLMHKWTRTYANYTHVIRCAMHMWIHDHLLDHLQDLCRGAWLADELVDMILGRNH